MSVGLARRGRLDPLAIDRARRQLRQRAEDLQRSRPDRVQATLDRQAREAALCGAMDVLVLRRDGTLARLVTRGSGLLEDSWWPSPLRRWPVRASRCGDWVRVRSADGRTDETGMIIENYGGASGTRG